MAFGQATFSDAGGAVSDLFAAEGYRFKAKGNLLEAGSYDEAAKFSDLNATFTEESTAIKEHQAHRQLLTAMTAHAVVPMPQGFVARDMALQGMARHLSTSDTGAYCFWIDCTDFDGASPPV
jgi:hypothetical protein